MLDIQAVEEDEDGMGVSGSSNSDDDQDMSNLSYVTDGTGEPLTIPYDLK